MNKTIKPKRLHQKRPLYIAVCLFVIAFAQFQSSQTLADHAEGARTLVVALFDNSPLFSYRDSSGEMRGFNVDIAKALCMEMKAHCSFSIVPFAEILPGIESGRFDYAVASMLRKPEREQRVDFTDRYWRSSSTFVARKGSLSEEKLQQAKSLNADFLKGLRVGAVSGSTQARFLQTIAPDNFTLMLFEDSRSRSLALLENRIDIALATMLNNFAFLNSPQGQNFQMIGRPLYNDGLGGEVSIPVQKGRRDLRQALNEALSSLLISGRYSQINNTYFPFSIY